MKRQRAERQGRQGERRAALYEAKPSQAAARVAKATGMDRRVLYARAMELQRE